MPRDIVDNVMVTLTAEEVASMAAVARPYEPKSTTMRRCMMEALSPRDTVLRYRLPPGHLQAALMPGWMDWGPVAAESALERAAHLARKGFEVETWHVAKTAASE
jgi:hypothetical protein